MFKLKTDRDLAQEIVSLATLHGYPKAVAMVREANPSQTLNLEALAEWVEFYKPEA